MARRIVSELIDGPAGKLEALLEEPGEREPAEAALVCHPHPQYGGTMRNKVVHRLARGLRSTGSVVLRFNFRGVNLSQGAWDDGRGELEDARVCLGWLRERYRGLPLALAGFSFGSRIVMELASQAPEVSRVVAVAFPAAYGSQAFLDMCRAPRYFVHGTQDQHGPREAMETLFTRLPEPKQILWIEGASHFFDGKLDEFEEAVKSLPRGTPGD